MYEEEKSTYMYGKYSQHDLTIIRNLVTTKLSIEEYNIIII